MNSTDRPKNQRVLVIDDNPAIHKDFEKILGPRSNAGALEAAEAALFGAAAAPVQNTSVELAFALQGEEGLARVQEATAANRRFAVAFVDARMPPGWDGIVTIAKLWEADPDVQVVLCTAYSDYSLPEIQERLGVSDRLLILKKPFDSIEVLQITSALTEKWRLLRESRRRMDDLEDMVSRRTAELHATNAKLRSEIEQRKAAAEELCKMRNQLSHLLANSPVVTYSLRIHGEELVPAWVSENLTRLMGWTTSEWLQPSWIQDRTHPDDLAEAAQFAADPLAEGASRREYRLRHADGSYRWVYDERRVVHGPDGAGIEVVGAFTDVTERKQLEEQLRQSQKMEAIGQLAGGVAHDFNNLLTVIGSYSNILLEAPSLPAALREPVTQIVEAANRAGDLTRQMLAYGRRQVMRPEDLNVAERVASLSKMLTRILGEDIALEFESLDPELAIRADRTMLDQILLNLAANARDAMPTGGRLILQTSAIHVNGESPRRNPDARSGSFCLLAVTDTGCGIPRDILPRIFDPFFTTKEAGKGTGLGLATVYGIVKLHHGWIECESEEGRGTTFQVFLPRAATSPHSASRAALPAEKPVERTDETVLFVEDEPALRQLAEVVLSHEGYRLLQASNGIEALAMWRKHGASIDILVTDLVMPAGITGRELASMLQRERPELRIVYTSGYSPDVLASDSVMSDEINFLPKPYTPASLLQAVRRAPPNRLRNGMAKELIQLSRQYAR
jgi:PAS domain S-box-containing protein